MQQANVVTTPTSLSTTITGAGASSKNNTTTASKNATPKTTVHKFQDAGILLREDFHGGPVSLNEIETGLYLGNLSAATHMETLKKFKITHILTLDSVPLPKHIEEASFLTTKYVHIADMQKEDILHHLDACVDFISDALKQEGNVLVHCYFGVSRSSSAVIAYVMKRHNLDYQQAYELVKMKRRFVQPNTGFVAQLKLYKRMGCKIDVQYQRYKMYRLRLAGEQLRKVKILPQNFHNVIKPDPAVTQENPEPIVYRCRKCRRILASKSHVFVHHNKLQAATTTTQTLAAPPTTTSLQTVNTTEAIVEVTAQAPPRLLEQIAAQIRKVSLSSPTAEAAAETQTAQCQNILFVEPIAWMKNVFHNTQGRLNCPKCEQKLGNFSWVNGCQCPCGEEVSPAFYLIQSKIELSKTVQNVQTTV